MRHVGEYSPAKTGEYPRIFPNFQNCARWVKDSKDNKDTSLHLGRKYARICSDICPWTLSVPPARYSEQMSAEIFALNGGYCLYNRTTTESFLFAFLLLINSLIRPLFHRRSPGSSSVNSSNKSIPVYKLPSSVVAKNPYFFKFVIREPVKCSHFYAERTWN